MYDAIGLGISLYTYCVCVCVCVCVWVCGGVCVCVCVCVCTKKLLSGDRGKDSVRTPVKFRARSSLVSLNLHMSGRCVRSSVGPRFDSGEIFFFKSWHGFNP